jgi:2-phosphosulfolactate phosphatase
MFYQELKMRSRKPAGEVVIDCFPQSARRYGAGWTVVTVDVIRATTTAVTAAAHGRRCIPARDLTHAYRQSDGLLQPLLAGELGGDKPPGFELANSPSAVALRADIYRPLVLVTSSGTPLICEAAASDEVYLGCFRNSAATARHLIQAETPRVAVLGAGTRDEFREEDQICCAWIAAALVRAGYTSRDRTTCEVISRWQHSRPADCLSSRSVDYLLRSGQLADLHFVLTHHNDMDSVFRMDRGEVVMLQQRACEGAGCAA